jgi:hypothetical protein
MTPDSQHCQRFDWCLKGGSQIILLSEVFRFLRWFHGERLAVAALLAHRLPASHGRASECLALGLKDGVWSGSCEY